MSIEMQVPMWIIIASAVMVVIVIVSLFRYLIHIVRLNAKCEAEREFEADSYDQYLREAFYLVFGVQSGTTVEASRRKALDQQREETDPLRKRYMQDLFEWAYPEEEEVE